MLQDIAWQKASGRVETSWRLFYAQGTACHKKCKKRCETAGLAVKYKLIMNAHCSKIENIKKEDINENGVIAVQKIYIRNNGPVKDFEMEIGKFNLLIGEQATGKSTIAKSVYYFKLIKTKIVDYLTQIYDSNTYHNIPQENVWFDKAVKSELKNIFIRLFGYSWDLNPEFYMKYEYADGLWIQVKLKNGDRNRQYISVTYSMELITETFMMLIDSVRNSFRNGLKQAHLFYPIEKRAFNTRDLTDFIVDIEKGEYFYSAGKEYLKIEEDAEHPVAINFASSGQQEILWLLNFMYVLLLRQEKAFLIIEEPEAHIYPLLQKKVMEFIALFTNVQDSGVFITTHSPYVLIVANNLYYAGVLAEEGQAKEVQKAINKNYVMPKGGLSAYKLLGGNGGNSYINLLEEDGREIKSSLIDDVSAQVNELYTALYDIDLDKR